jgi:thioredoxin 1
MKDNLQDLNWLISTNECGGLNIDGDAGISNIFNNSNNTVKSNSGDATMITSIKFKDKVNIVYIQVNGVSEETNPIIMKCYVNKLDIDFSDVSDVPSTQKFDLKKEINKKIKVNVPKWKNVSELTLYFENEEADYLNIKQIQFFGSAGSHNINIGEMKKSEDENYVPIKGNEVTEGIFSLKSGETIEGFLSKNPGKVVFVDFHAKWCGPCKQLGPILCQKAAEIGALVLKVDIDQHRNIAMKNNISSIPVVFLYKDGIKIDSMVGFNPQALDYLISRATN